MYIYDQANALAHSLSQCDEYKTYETLKEEVYADESTASLLKQYKKLQFEAQLEVYSGKQPSEETMDQLKKLGDVLAFNPKISEFFAAEYKVQTLVSDIYKIIGDACKLDTGMFGE